VRTDPAVLDGRRGVVRLHPEVLDALGLRAWDAVRLSGNRTTAALAAPAPAGSQLGEVLVDDLTLSNLQLVEGSSVTVTSSEIAAARSLTVSGSTMSRASLTPDTLRLALLGKVVTPGDAVSLLPQDLAPPSGADLPAVRRRLSAAIGSTWTSELLTVTRAEPHGTVAIGPSTTVHWHNPDTDGATPPATADRESTDGETTPTATEPSTPPPQISELAGSHQAARTLREWSDPALHRPELPTKLGAAPQLGALLTGPDGVGKETLVRSVAQADDIPLTTLDASALVLRDGAAARDRIAAAAKQAAATRPGLVLITNVDTMLPATARPPAATLLLQQLREVLQGDGAAHACAVIASTAHPESVDARLKTPDLLDRELTLPMRTAADRIELLRSLLRETPLEPDIEFSRVAERTPGFVVADLIALRRDAALRAALRQRADPDPVVTEKDLVDAATTVRPAVMSDSDSLNTGGLTLDDVGDMTAAKQTLTETDLWPLRYPDSFTRLGIEAPRGVLLHGPPGTGKTILVRALAGTGALNVFTVKGSELMNKWVGESE